MARLTPEAALKSMCGWNDDEMKRFGLLLEEAAVETKNAADPSIKLRAHIFRPLSDYLEDLADDDSDHPDLDDYLPGLHTYLKKRFPGRGEGKATKSRNQEIRRHKYTLKLPKPHEGYNLLRDEHPEMVYHDVGSMRIVDYSEHDYRRDWNRLKPI